MDDIDKIQELEVSRIADRLSAIQREFTIQPASRECVECGDEIPDERRAALPHAMRCLECQSLLEKDRRFRY